MATNNEKDRPDGQNGYPDIYAGYRDGVKEFAVSMAPRTDVRLLIVSLFASLGGIAIALAIMNLPWYALAVVCLMILSGLGVLMALRHFDAKTAKDPADESPDTRVESDDSESARRITKRSERGHFDRGRAPSSRDVRLRRDRKEGRRNDRRKR